VVLVNTMTEAHEDLLLVLDTLDESGDILNITDLFEHAKYGLVGTTVAGAVESGHSAGKGGVDIGLGAGHMADGSGGAVKLVLGVEDEKDINGFNDLGVNAEVLVAGVLVHHVKEVLNVTEVFLGLVDGLADTVAVAGGSDGWGASEDTVDMLVALLAGLVNVGTNVSRVGLRVERAHGSHEGAHHGHGVSVVAEGLDERLKSVVVVGLGHNFLIEDAKLCLGGQFSVKDQESSLNEGRLIGQLLNGDTTVLKNSLVTIDVGNSGDARNSVHESGIV
jgi:hypothetical protein